MPQPAFGSPEYLAMTAAGMRRPPTAAETGAFSPQGGGQRRWTPQGPPMADGTLYLRDPMTGATAIADRYGNVSTDGGRSYSESLGMPIQQFVLQGQMGQAQPFEGGGQGGYAPPKPPPQYSPDGGRYVPPPQYDPEGGGYGGGRGGYGGGYGGGQPRGGYSGETEDQYQRRMNGGTGREMWWAGGPSQRPATGGYPQMPGWPGGGGRQPQRPQYGGYGGEETMMNDMRYRGGYGGQQPRRSPPQGGGGWL